MTSQAANTRSLAAPSLVHGASASRGVPAGLLAFAAAAGAVLRRIVGQPARRSARPAGEELLRSMVDAVSVEVMRFDADQRLVALNQAVCEGNTWTDASRWIGWKFEEIIRASVAHHRGLDPARDWDAWVGERLAQFENCGIEDVHRANGD